MHEDKGMLEGNLDDQSIIVSKVVEDCLWLAPGWFSTFLESYNTDDICKYHELTNLDQPLTPQILTIFGARVREDKELYPRILGAIAANCYGYLHPIGCLAGAFGYGDAKTGAIINRFDTELADTVYMVPTQRTDFNHFSLSKLEESCIMSQESCIALGEKLHTIYSNGTSFFEEPKLVVEFYGNVVNLALYCWLMTTNQDILSYSEELLEKQPSLSKNFYTPLTRKGKQLWASLRTNWNS